MSATCHMDKDESGKPIEKVILAACWFPTSGAIVGSPQGSIARSLQRFERERERERERNHRGQEFHCPSSRYFGTYNNYWEKWSFFFIFLEFFVKNANRVELMAMLGHFGAIVSAIQISILECIERKSIHWATEAVKSTSIIQDVSDLQDFSPWSN
ncbi:hypothetical protein RIF29_12386 [Crotalaria pallida]|uniref:Uncharacterized protein n=1 Tax=Crotalaria pallida TaxID=3830 RepID=A0AAN9IN35_CROPI